MASAKFPLVAGGPRRLEISWGTFWNEIIIMFDGREVGRIPSKTEHNQGTSIRLPDGSEIHVRLVQSFVNSELQVTYNGRPLPGSASDPATRVKRAGYILCFIAGFYGLCA